jgi:hypothetical protein
MTADQYVLWFIGMAVGIALILSLGTLTMAGLLRRPGHHPEETADIAPPAPHDEEHHHWYDRFHFHHAA